MKYLSYEISNFYRNSLEDLHVDLSLRSAYAITKDATVHYVSYKFPLFILWYQKWNNFSKNSLKLKTLILEFLFFTQYSIRAISATKAFAETATQWRTKLLFCKISKGATSGKSVYSIFLFLTARCRITCVAKTLGWNMLFSDQISEEH